MIEVHNIGHGFARKGNERDLLPVLENISFTIPDGQIVSLLGPSGCGKTTLLRIIDGLIQPLVGEIRIDGVTVRKPDTGRAMVFQEFNLLPWRTALRNIEFAGELHDIPRRERRARAEAVLKRVGLGRFGNYYPHQLSGGMKQRIGIARALGTNPKVLLMDEPFGALDPQIREMMQLELMKLWDSDRKTVVFVTHSVDEAVFLSDRVIMFGTSPGRVVADLAIDLPRPRWTDDEAIKTSAKFIQYRNDIWRMLKRQLNSMPAI